MGDMDREMESMTLNSPNFPNYPDPDTELRCVIKENNGETFRMNTLETWATFQGTMDTPLNEHMQINGIAEEENITMPDHMINRFNRFVNFSTFINQDLEQLRFSYSSLETNMKFTLQFEGNFATFQITLLNSFFSMYRRT